jgi:putative SOS response-associated peptidase YedK
MGPGRSRTWAVAYSLNVRAVHISAYMERDRRLYRLTLDTPARNLQPRYNICPTTTIDAVVERDGKRADPDALGLVPSWWKNRSRN